MPMGVLAPCVWARLSRSSAPHQYKWIFVKILLVPAKAPRWWLGVLNKRFCFKFLFITIPMVLQTLSKDPISVDNSPLYPDNQRATYLAI